MVSPSDTVVVDTRVLSSVTSLTRLHCIRRDMISPSDTVELIQA